MPRSIEVEDEAEALVATRAVQTYRALRAAVRTAPHGKGLATVEAVVRDAGFDHLSKMYESAVRAHPEAQKGGPAPGRARAASGRRSGGRRPSTS